MIASHVSHALEPAERGREVGERFAAQTTACVAAYERLFDALDLRGEPLHEIGESLLTRIEEWAPDLGRELHAQAAAAGVASWQLGMLNGRTEILATLDAIGEGDCSTSVVVPADGSVVRTVQTWDWHEEVSPDALAWSYAVGSRRVHAFTEHGILGKIGVSSEGLGVHFNILHHERDGGDPGVPVHVVARRILDECASIEEAVELARTARVSASTVLTLVARTEPRALCLELSPLGPAVVHPDPEGVLLHTNHFLDPDLALGEAALASSSTYVRIKQLHDRTAALSDPDPVARAQAMAIHDAGTAAVCCHPDLDLPWQRRWSTLLVATLDVEKGELGFHDGRPCEVRRATWSRI